MSKSPVSQKETDDLLSQSLSIKQKIAIKNGKEVESYTVKADEIPVQILICTTQEDFVPVYNVIFPKFDPKILAEIENIKKQIISEVKISMDEIIDMKKILVVKQKFLNKILELLSTKFPTMEENWKKIYAYRIIHEMLGLGNLEVMLSDDKVEEIVINNSSEPVWVYHKKYGWLKTNITVGSEEEIYNYAAAIGRRSGREITELKPLMDTFLTTGDRVNATLSSISIKGNTITIRKFPRKSFTITDFIKNKTVDSSILSLIWQAIEHEMSLIIVGGTATGKTSFLNAISAFIPPNQRVISIEDTKELSLPQFLHWIPMVVKEPNPEGKGAVSMLDLLVNSLRMRPDRIIVGEIRRHEEAEVLFEAMHTGHSVMATLHAFDSEEALIRLTNPPINVHESMIAALDLLLVLGRLRREGIRKLTEFTEIVPFVDKDGRYHVTINPMFKFHIKTGEIIKSNPSKRIIENLQEISGMSYAELKNDLYNKKKVIDWIVANDINTVNSVGKVIAEYYKDSEAVLQKINSGAKPEDILGSLVK
ncbi:MAG: ATPase, T2SS/T4P/T4SS family [Candidatus Aenigmatarchaeota archaeon]